MEETGRRKKIGKILLCILYSIFFAGCFFCVNVYAQEREVRCEEDGLSLMATFSFQEEDGEEITLRAGRDFVLRLTVTAGKEAFSGCVNVLMQNEQENHVLYQQGIGTVEPGGSASCQMVLPMNLMTEGLYLTLTDEEGTVCLEHSVPIETVNYGLSELVAVYDPEGATENFYMHFSSYGNRVVDISETELACGPQGMDALDVIVTREFVLEGMEERAADAEDIRDAVSGEGENAGKKAGDAVLVQESLKEWVAGGKTLVVGMDPQGGQEEMLNLGLQDKETLQEVILRVGNYEATRESILATNREIKKQYGENARTSYIGDSMLGSASVNSLSDRAVALPIGSLSEGGHWWDTDDAYETLWQERGEDILRRYRVGKGNVLVFAVPITAKPDAEGIFPLFYYRMADMVFENLTQEQVYRQNTELYGYSEPNRNYLLTYIRAKNSGISVIPYVIILLVYILILIPTVFLLLRHLEKTKYLWGILPALSLAVMGIVYLAGSRTRLTEPYCTYIDLMDYTGGSGKETVNFTLSAPTNGGTEVMLRAGSAVRLSQTGFRAYEVGWVDDDYLPEENTLLAREYRAAVCVAADGTKLCLDTIRAFAKTDFYAYADAPACEGMVTAEITSGARVAAGTVRNTTGMAFRAVYVCSPSFAVKVGSMGPGEEILLEDCRQIMFGEDSGGYYGSEFYGLLMDLAEGRDYGETEILRSIISDYVKQDEEKTFIFALPQEEVEGILKGAVKNAGSGGIQMFIWAVDGNGADIN